jgi:hypothetical protein
VGIVVAQTTGICEVNWKAPTRTAPTAPTRTALTNQHLSHFAILPVLLKIFLKIWLKIFNLPDSSKLLIAYIKSGGILIANLL